MELQLGTNWQIVYQANLQAQAIPLLINHFTPIPAFTIPYNFSNKLIVGASSSSAKPTWRLAFYANALVDILGIGSVEVARFYCPLGASLIDPQGERASLIFKLKIYVPRWHRNMDFEIWQYVGPP